MSENLHIRYVGEIPVIDLQGKITLGESAAKVRQSIEDLLGQGKTHILLNLSQITYVDSAGLGALASCHVKAAGQGGSLGLCAVTPRVTELLVLTRLNEKLTIYPDEKSALARMSAPVTDS